MSQVGSGRALCVNGFTLPHVVLTIDVCVSSVQHIERIKATATMKPRELNRLGDEFVSIYLNQQSFQCAQLAAGSCFNAVDQILSGQV